LVFKVFLKGEFKKGFFTLCMTFYDVRLCVHRSRVDKSSINRRFDERKRRLLMEGRFWPPPCWNL